MLLQHITHFFVLYSHFYQHTPSARYWEINDFCALSERSAFSLDPRFWRTFIRSTSFGSLLSQGVKRFNSSLFDLELVLCIQAGNENPAAVNHMILKLQSRNMTEVEVSVLEHQKIIVVTGLRGGLNLFAIGPFHTLVQEGECSKRRYRSFDGKIGQRNCYFRTFQKAQLWKLIFLNAMAGKIRAVLLLQALNGF